MGLTGPTGLSLVQLVSSELQVDRDAVEVYTVEKKKKTQQQSLWVSSAF